MSEERIVDVNGISVRYLTASEGPPLVLLHGAGDNALDWWWTLPALTRTHRVYAPDLPGSPDSARPAADYSSAFFERFVATSLDALGIERAAFVGNSLGGLISLRLALLQPARVTTLILVNSAGLGRTVNPTFTSVNVPGLGERRRCRFGELRLAPTRGPGGERRRSSLVPRAYRPNGWRNSAGWRSRRATWKPT